MKKYLIFIMAALLLGVQANAQDSFLQRLGNSAKNRAESTARYKTEQAVDQAVDKAMDKAADKISDLFKKKDKKDDGKDSADNGWTCPSCGATGNTGNFCQSCGTKKPEPKQEQNGWTCPSCGTAGNTGNFCQSCGTKKPDGNAAAAQGGWTCPDCGKVGNTGNFCDDCGAKKPEAGVAAAPAAPVKKKAEAAYAKSDFVPGDEIIFDDDFAAEQLGEFPSKWDLISGVSEVVKYDGKMAIDFQDTGTRVAPLMKNPRNYLTDEFTVECDFYAGDNSTIEEDLYSRSNYRMGFYTEDGTQVCGFDWHTADYKTVNCDYTSTSDRVVNSDAEIGAYLNDGEWNHLSISFNKRAFKAYINGTRVVNIPNMKAPNYLELEGRLWSDHGVNFITNFRIAKGAVPLYDRLATDGKIITYAITFDTGKATLKPEADVEINRIKGLLDQDPSLKFEVQGHCDSTGSAATNDRLSQQRAEAIVARLEELGIAKGRLTAVGKGSHEPVADNSTDEGRAKNRRVEFVKK